MVRRYELHRMQQFIKQHMKGFSKNFHAFFGCCLGDYSDDRGVTHTNCS
jgi:hypothetical protein